MSDDEKPKWVDLFGIDPDWPVSDHERENHALHRILRDLIAELRDENEWHFTAMANRAEARLRKATGDE